jgi:hypothetical protein
VYVLQHVMVDYNKKKLVDKEPTFHEPNAFFGLFSVDEFDLLDGGIFAGMEDFAEDVPSDGAFNLQLARHGDTADTWGCPAFEQWSTW